MSKSNDQTLIFPGESGWEIWQRRGENGFELEHTTELLHAGEMVDLPAGALTMLFPVRCVTAVPLRVMTTEDALFEDLVALHAERSGLKTDPLAGQLSDVFVVEREEESTVLLAVFLRPPGERDLPSVSPQSFDLSTRALPVEGNAVSIWKELGRWVFAIHMDGKLLYTQATANCSAAPDTQLASELKLALMQLSMQGLEVTPTRIELWSSSASSDVSALRDAFDLPVEISQRPQLELPAPLSKLLPEDVRAARRTAQRRQRITLAVAAAIIFYVGLMTWLGLGLWQDAREAKELQARADEASPEVKAYETHMNKWNELADAIDLDHDPVDILYRVHGCFPPRGGLRLTQAVISANSVSLAGEAPASTGYQTINRFNLKLTKNPSLSRFKWTAPPPKESSLGLKFNYKGELPVSQSAP